MPSSRYSRCPRVKTRLYLWGGKALRVTYCIRGVAQSIPGPGGARMRARRLHAPLYSISPHRPHLSARSCVESLAHTLATPRRTCNFTLLYMARDMRSLSHVHMRSVMTHVWTHVQTADSWKWCRGGRACRARFGRARRAVLPVQGRPRHPDISPRTTGSDHGGRGSRQAARLAPAS